MSTTEKKVKELKITTVDYKTYTDYEFIPPGLWMMQNAIGDYIFISTSSRQEAQDWVDSNYPPKGKYKVTATKMITTKPKSESGNLSCTGTATRKK
jgi:hypothetical protein